MASVRARVSPVGDRDNQQVCALRSGVSTRRSLDVVEQDVADGRGVGVFEQRTELRERRQDLRRELQHGKAIGLGGGDDGAAVLEIARDSLADEIVGLPTDVRERRADKGE